MDAHIFSMVGMNDKIFNQIYLQVWPKFSEDFLVFRFLGNGEGEGVQRYHPVILAGVRQGWLTEQGMWARRTLYKYQQ